VTLARLSGSRLTVPVPHDFNLPRDCCSYGYFLLAPNHWDVDSQSLYRVLELPGGPSTVRMDQADTGVPLRARFDRALDRAEHGSARAQVSRMLRLDEPADHIVDFHRTDPRWKKAGQGRLFRSPTLFEDVVKTVTSCNVAWPSTIKMNERLCAVVGRKSPAGPPAFPTAKKLARTRVGTLRARCSVGYRDQRIVDLAKLFATGKIDEPWLGSPGTPDDDVFRFLLTLPGIGPYAAGNIMQLLGRYSRLALDTESVRHGKSVLGYTGTDRAILKQLAAHYEPFGEHRFRSYWFELWSFYESKRGPAHLWERETVGKTFTAALLAD
jgi:3-methyladenine DNA glycosylase/8-oxoguanine DNA glycosylase